MAAARPRTPRTPKNAREAARHKAAAKAAALLKAQKASFLAALADSHLVSEAAKQAGVHRQRAYEWRTADEAFADAWAEIEERSTEILEQIAVKRAADGSDLLLIFLLKARRPDVYREQHKIEHSGPQGGPIEAEVTGVNAREAADATREFLARLAPSG